MYELRDGTCLFDTANSTYWVIRVIDRRLNLRIVDVLVGRVDGIVYWRQRRDGIGKNKYQCHISFFSGQTLDRDKVGVERGVRRLERCVHTV